MCCKQQISPKNKGTLLVHRYLPLLTLVVIMTQEKVHFDSARPNKRLKTSENMIFALKTHKITFLAASLCAIIIILQLTLVRY